MRDGHSDSRAKSPVLVEAGRRGALARWGPARVVRLDDFPADERAAIVAAIEAKRAAKAARARRETPEAA